MTKKNFGFRRSTRAQPRVGYALTRKGRTCTGHGSTVLECAASVKREPMRAVWLEGFSRPFNKNTVQDSISRVSRVCVLERE
jgi:hypothetical protein